MYECGFSYSDGGKHEVLTDEELEELDCADQWVAMLAEDDVLAEFAASGWDLNDF